MLLTKIHGRLFGLLRKKSPAIFLDNALPDKQNRYSYLFLDPVKILKTKKYEEVKDILEQVSALSLKYWVAGFLSYEAGYCLEPKLLKTLTLPSSSSFLAWFGVYEFPHRFDHYSGKWFPSEPGEIFSEQTITNKKNNSPEIELSFSMDYPEFEKRLHSIKELIRSGDTYQVNYTFDVSLKAKASPVDLYFHLRKKQKTPYCAFIQNAEETILSFSPELFFRRAGNRIWTKPMKGTAPRGRWNTEDRATRKQLSRDLKNRSENVMIVDLLRNDLGRICRTGSVKVSRLFQVETHPTLFQMTSTIKGTLKPAFGYAEIFRSIFPSGSVTGAPKIRTMQIIKSLEKGMRGVYCGAIGFMSPKKQAVFSVPIRTLRKKTASKKWIYRVGSGIVWDSYPETEWEECRTKCKFLGGEHLPDFEIFESILWKKRMVYLKDHITRMSWSAKSLGYPLESDKLDSLIRKINKILKNKKPGKIRIFLNKMGKLRWDFALINTSSQADARILVSDYATNENNIFMYHKTTYMPWYKEARERIKKGECFDVIFHNSKGEITEGARSNVFIEIRGVLYTPPLECGVLPGVLRKNLLRRKKCKEKIFSVSDLKKADKIFCGNSVRGLKRVRLV